MNTEPEIQEGTEVDIADSGTLATLIRGEIDQQITTAKRFPRSIKKFRDECLSMVTLTEEIADECIYALPRDGKTIEGPSARFAEVVASAWGNCRAGARVVSEEGDFVTAQGAFYDLERNVAIQYEVKRRITDKHNRRYKADMIAVTANAACSVALRNAILKGVPKAFWIDMYKAARQTVIGDVKTMANRRAEALAFLQKMGITEPMVLATLGVTGVEDIKQDHLVTLRGLVTALRDGDTTVEEAFINPAVQKTTHAKTESVAEGTASSLNDIKARHGVQDPKQQPSSPEAQGTQTPPAASSASQEDTQGQQNSTDNSTEQQPAETKQQTQASSTSPKEGLFEAPDPFAREPKGRRR
jgi:hypothetical protein